jgi:hypothetical protein
MRGHLPYCRTEIKTDNVSNVVTSVRRHPAATFAQPGGMDEKVLLRITKEGGGNDWIIERREREEGALVV